MKNRVLGILVTVLIMVSLAGCGTQAKATDDEVVDGETIIVAEEDTENEAIIEEEEITETEVIEEPQEEATYTEYELFYMRDSLDMTDATEMDMNALSVDGNTYTLNKSINIYAPTVGALMSYTKPNIEVYVNSCNEEWYCLRFDVDGDEKFVLAKADDFIAATGIEPKEEIAVTADDVKQVFTELVTKLEIEYELLDSPSGDMEYIEFSIPKDCENLEDWIGQMYISNEMSHYATYCIVLEDKDYGDGYLNFKFYYKNLKELPQ
ncbi:MAG: hypothetical protein HDQ96_10155 [Lachnospiraceae bacterium]|nr:hypothetical protein [Lachnospiraceae bacterium]